MPTASPERYDAGMANTFADHILGLIARGSSARPSQIRSRPLAATAQCQAPATRSATYASVVLLMGLGAVATPVTAASDGAIAQGGATSLGRVRISLTIPERIDVRGMRGIELARDAAGGVGGETAGCIFGHGAGQYAVSALDADADNFEVVFAAGTAAPRALTMGEALRRLEGAGAGGCADGTSNARLALRMKPAAASLSGQPLPLLRPERGALTLLIAPE